MLKTVRASSLASACLVILGSSTVSFAETANQCSLEDVKAAALNIGQLYSQFKIDGVDIVTTQTKVAGVHQIESYQLWLAEGNNQRTLITLDFVVRPAGSMFYKTVGCGLIGVSIPPFLAP